MILTVKLARPLEKKVSQISSCAMTRFSYISQHHCHKKVWLLLLWLTSSTSYVSWTQGLPEVSLRRSNLKRQLETHSGEKPYKCDQCDYASAERGSLKRHLRIHSGEKPFKCNKCDYTFSQSCHLRKHLRIHSREVMTWGRYRLPSPP